MGKLKITVLGHEHPLLGICQDQERRIRGAILFGEIKCVNNIMPTLLKPTGQAPRQLSINEEFQAAKGTMRCTLDSRAANARQALMSSRSRSG